MSRFVSVVARVLLGLVFLAAGGLKGMNPHGSAIAVGAFQMTPPMLSLVGGILLPAIEVVTGAALLTGFFLRGALVLSFGLSTMFATGVVSVMVRGLDLECGCFGHLAITPRAGWGTIAFDGSLLALTLLIAFTTRRR